MARAFRGDNESRLNAELRMRPSAYRLTLLAALLLALTWLSACADPTKFAPACPQSAYLPDGSDLTRYRRGGHDITDLVLNARISKIDAHCAAGDKTTELRAWLQVAIKLQRGPAAKGRSADLAYFIAVSRGDQILDKAVYPVHVTFPANIDSVDITTDRVDMVIPTPKGVGGPDYTVTVGFQLTPDELGVNRTRKPNT
jgi:hypothetical protein